MTGPKVWPSGRHPGLAALEQRLRLRWMLVSLRLGLFGALIGVAIAAVVGKLLAHDGWINTALVWSVLAIVVAILARIRRWPNVRTVAFAADGLGLQERLTSSLEARRTSHPMAMLLEQDAARALARLRPEEFPLVPDPRTWRGLAALAIGAAILVAVPLPSLGDRARQADEARTVQAARRALDRPTANLVRLAPADQLAADAATELQQLDRDLAELDATDSAAQRLESAQERLASLARPEDFAWRRALDAMAQRWAQDPELQSLARAARAHDERAIEQAAAELAARSQELDGDDMRQLSLGLQAGANAARDVPSVAGALRELASEAAGAIGDEATEATEYVGDALAQGAARASGLDATQQAVASVGTARASLGANAASASGSQQAARGSRSGASSAQGGRSGTGGSASGQASAGTGQGAGAQAQASGAQATAGPAAAGAGTGSSASGGAGSTSAGTSGGASASAGAGSGTGGSSTGSGSGAGAGAGTGGSGYGAEGAAGSGGAAGQRGDPGPSEIAGNAPLGRSRMLGGEAGPDVAVAGDAGSASGDTVQLPDSPLTLGAVRPYQSVYGEYEEHARQSLAQQPLPPALESLVQRYFSAIAPSAGADR